MSIKPIGERILVEKIKKEEKTNSGIILTSSSNANKENIAKVVAVGDGEKVSKSIKAGNTVIHSEYSGTNVKHQNKEYLILEFDNVLGIIE